MTTKTVADGAKKGADVTLNAASKQTPNYTQEQLDKAVRDAKSAALADANRFQLEAGRAMKAAQAAQKRIEEIQKQELERELEAAKDEPERTARIGERQRRIEVESELAQTREELETANATLTEVNTREAEATKTRIAQEVAERLGVNAVTLAKLAKATDGTVEAIEDMAKELPKVEEKPGGRRFDSNRSSGGNITFEQIRAEFIKDPYNRKISQLYLEMKGQQT